MRGGQVAVVILYKVEVLDQQVAAARPVEQQRANFLQSIQVDLTAFGGSVWSTAAAFFFAARPTVSTG
jgi:hypothetical protein